VTGPATSSDGNYVSAPGASYAAARPVVNYTSTASTPAATYAATYASAQASTRASVPTSTSTAAAATHTHTNDFVSGEQYRYALTNFVRTNIYPKGSLHFHSLALRFPHVDSDSHRIRLGHRT
jgi:hypothetical protein